MMQDSYILTYQKTLKYVYPSKVTLLTEKIGFIMISKYGIIIIIYFEPFFVRKREDIK